MFSWAHCLILSNRPNNIVKVYDHLIFTNKFVENILYKTAETQWTIPKGIFKNSNCLTGLVKDVNLIESLATYTSMEPIFQV